MYVLCKAPLTLSLSSKQASTSSPRAWSSSLIILKCFFVPICVLHFPHMGGFCTCWRGCWRHIQTNSSLSCPLEGRSLEEHEHHGKMWLLGQCWDPECKWPYLPFLGCKLSSCHCWPVAWRIQIAWSSIVDEERDTPSSLGEMVHRHNTSPPTQFLNSGKSHLLLPVSKHWKINYNALDLTCHQPLE